MSEAHGNRRSPSAARAADTETVRSDDPRLYVLHPEDWTIHAKLTWEKDYCHAQRPGEDYFHLIVKGELYVQRESEKLCLLCALRRGIITRDRLNWQKRSG